MTIRLKFYQTENHLKPKMDRKLLFVSLFIAIFIVDTTDGLRYFPCNKRICRIPRSCKGGLVKGICRCCYVCAKQIREYCGGYLGIYGKCDRHLTCLQTSKFRRGTCIRRYIPRPCGPVCLIYCRYGNVLDSRGCPTCRCRPGPIKAL